MAEKIYVPKCSAKEKTFDDGGSLIKIGVQVDALVEFAQAHANERGYVNLVVQKRREPSAYGDTHTVYLDTYKREG